MGRTKNIGKVVPVSKKWLSKDEALAYLGCSERFLQTLRNDALVSFARYGNKMYWYELDSLNAFIEQHKVC